MNLSIQSIFPIRTVQSKAVGYTSSGNEVEIEETRFRIFSQLWAIATLFHMAHSSLFDTELEFALLTLSAIYVIARPRVNSLFLLAVLQLFDAGLHMPYTTNHWIFTAFVNATIIQVLIFKVIREKTFSPKGKDLLSIFGPLVKAELIILYFFAVFHKLNAGFFAPLTSCATDLLVAQQVDSIVALTPELIALNAYFTIAIESAIPIMLCFRRTRNAGIFFGIVFHCIISYSTYNAFFDFSSMILALYFLFASPALASTIITLKRNMRNSLQSAFSDYSPLKLGISAIVLIFFLGVIYISTKTINSFQEVHLYFFWTLYTFTALFCFVYFLSRRFIAINTTESVRIPNAAFLIIPIIVFFNGMSPYLGLKTENSYSMFSNLRTEGGISNHFIVPAAVQIFDFQKDVVDILHSSDEKFQKLAEQNKSLVLFEFKSWLKERKPTSVTYRHNGQVKTFSWEDKDNNDYAGLTDHSFILAKLMKFRAFQQNGPQPCTH